MANSYFSKIPGFYRPKTVKKRLWHKYFPVNLVKFVRTPFLQNISGRLLLLLAFHNHNWRCSMKKGVFEIFAKLTGKERHVVCEIFKNTFLQNTSGRLLLAFPCNFTKIGHANSVWKTSDEYPLSRNANLRSTVYVYHFFLGSINFQCIFLLVYTVYC